MSAISITHDTLDMFETVRAENGMVSVTLVPELGGKLVSLRALRTGREWLWRNPRLPYRRVPYGVSFVEMADTGGWDECFPTVGACAYPSAPWQGKPIQDHGELWGQTAALDVYQTDNTVTFHTRWHGIALPYTFERSLTLNRDSAAVRCRYRVTNTGDAPLDWIWSSHPLLAIEPGMQLTVPPSARFHLGSSMPRGILSQTQGLQFPLTVGKFDLTALPPASAKLALKLWSEPLAEGFATMRAPDGALHMRWDTTQLPQLGIWLNLGAWSGDGGAPYYNLGLEPCIGAQDSLADAVLTYKQFVTLPPHAARTWWLEVELL